YWNPAGAGNWQAASLNLATTESATTGDTPTTWFDNVTLPTWSEQSSGTYTVQATATDKAGNTFTDAAAIFTLVNHITPTDVGTGGAQDNGTATTLTETGTVAVGNTIFVAVAMDPSSVNVTVDDNAAGGSNTYT